VEEEAVSTHSEVLVWLSCGISEENHKIPQVD